VGPHNGLRLRLSKSSRNLLIFSLCSTGVGVPGGTGLIHPNCWQASSGVRGRVEGGERGGCCGQLAKFGSQGGGGQD
jgi:hypothetical protein